MPWQPLSTAPRDGTCFDINRRGIRFTDCHFDEGGRLVREHGYPAVTKWFLEKSFPDIMWMPRPGGIIQPYEKNGFDERYVP